MVRRRWVTAVVVATALAGGATTEAGAATRQATCTAVGPRTLAYRHLPGVPVNLTSLDLYLPRGACRAGRGPAPVVVWVHGGGYAVGDKAQQVADKVRLFTGARLDLRQRELPPLACRRPVVGTLPRPLRRRRGRCRVGAPPHRRPSRRPVPHRPPRPLGRRGHRVERRRQPAVSRRPRAAAHGAALQRATRHGRIRQGPCERAGAASVAGRAGQRADLRAQHLGDAARAARDRDRADAHGLPRDAWPDRHRAGLRDRAARAPACRSRSSTPGG